MTNAGNIWHQTGNNSWTEIRADIVYSPGTIARARDIAVGPEAWAAESNVWITGHPSQNNFIFLLNRQADVFDADGDLEVVGQNNWTRTWAGGSATFLSVGKNSLPWVSGNGAGNTTWRLRP